jgi:purine-cytosine permease-like protein
MYLNKGAERPELLSERITNKVLYLIATCVGIQRTWGTCNVLTSGYRVFIPRKKSGWGVKLTTHIHIASRLRIFGTMPALSHTSSWRGV